MGEPSPAKPAGRCRKTNREGRRGAGGCYWGLVAAGEPFRLLFPLGALIGVAGVMMWPLFVWDLAGGYPGQAHARVMVEGFLTAFVVGFLGTALPRLLEVPRLTLAETLGFAAAVSAVAGLHFAGRTMAGDLMFLVTILALVLVLGVRAALFRKDVPPPGFVLVVLGLASAIFGAASQLLAEGMPGWLPVFGRLLLHQGYLLFPVMGIGAFLLPRFFGLPNRQSFPESLALPPGWMRRAGFALFCGGLVMAGFACEAGGGARAGFALRAVGVALYFFREVPVHQAGFGGGSLALGLRLALFAIPSAYGLMAAWPERAFSFLHVLFIGGFSLLTFVVASRVVLGHSGQAEKFRATLWPVLLMASMVTLAMLTRVTADWMPEIRMSHYAYAAVAWVAGVIAWGAGILPGVARAEEET